MKCVTILGCGLAGSWIAHHLASAMPLDFLLFDGGPSTDDSYSHLNIVNRKTSGMANSRAEALANHILFISPESKVETTGYFDPDKDLGRVRGIIVGAMSNQNHCIASAETVIRDGKSWLTFAIPTRTGMKALIASDLQDLTEDYFGPPALTRTDIWMESATAAHIVLKKFDA